MMQTETHTREIDWVDGWHDPPDIGWYLVQAEFLPESIETELGGAALVPLVLWFNPAATPRWWAGRSGACYPLDKIWGKPPRLLRWRILPQGIYSILHGEFSKSKL